jgi:hypothetical protein
MNGNQPVMRRPSILKLCSYLEETSSKLNLVIKIFPRLCVRLRLCAALADIVTGPKMLDQQRT